ncbi:MAG: NAD(+)/NADH kinase [Candidatus Obscuribacterales bacterium]|nr:NAD(+)/NADH kinase [Candidatus Obscuribacterales bacterium]
MKAQKGSKKVLFAPKRALVIVKQTMKELVDSSDDERLKQLLHPDNPDRQRIIASDKEHQLTHEHVVDVLINNDMTYRCVERAPGEHFETDEDLVITIGGDGTFLDASHSIRSDVPVLGVNSAPGTSHGHYCLTNRTGFTKTLSGIIAGKIKYRPLIRLRLTLDGVELAEPILNEVLISHKIPAGTTRYKLSIGGKTGEKKSSGLIVTTASGTTGLNLSAGGKLLPIASSSFAFSTLAPFLPPGSNTELLKGKLPEDAIVTVVSEMVNGQIFLDGAHITYDFGRGSKLVIDAGAPSLNAFIDKRCHDNYREVGS